MLKYKNKLNIFTKKSTMLKARRVKNIQFSVMNPELIKNSSVCEVTTPELYHNNKPKFHGLFDLRMGTMDPLFICNTCEQRMDKCPGHFGHIELAKPVYYIQFFNTVRKILQITCVECSSLLINKSNQKIINIIKKLSPKKKFKFIQQKCSNTKTLCYNPDCSLFELPHQPKYKRDGINLFMIFKKPGESQSEKLYPEDVYKRFKKIKDEDINLMGFNVDFSRPEWFICVNLPVPPPHVRPSVKFGNLRSEDDLTYKLVDIIKANNNLKKKLIQREKYREKKDDSSDSEDGEDDSGKKDFHIDEYLDYLQYNVITLIDNEVQGIPPAQQINGRLLKSLRQRLKGKTGLVRGNLMGKRVDFSARTVITPEPNIEIGELGVPKKIAENLTYPEIVNQFNIKKLQKLIENNPSEYPGAKYIIKKNGMKMDLRFCKKTPILRFGDKVERHLQNGDIVLFNRQPSLHKMSMMAHKVKVLPGLTFRLNIAVTSPYNADFDKHHCRKQVAAI